MINQGKIYRYIATPKKKKQKKKHSAGKDPQNQSVYPSVTCKQTGGSQTPENAVLPWQHDMVEAQGRLDCSFTRLSVSLHP